MDPNLVKYSKITKLSAYGNDYANWGKIKSKLVMKRPKEIYYPLKFPAPI